MRGFFFSKEIFMIAKSKNELHPRNRHQGRYDLKALMSICPELKKFVKLNEYDPKLGETIDFSNPQAVKILNKALLQLYYGISHWDLPSGALCPPIPGRADYIHYLADLLDCSASVKVLDIGTGANCVYPLIGQSEYNWSFVASDIDINSLKNAQKIIDANVGLNKRIELRLQTNKKNIFSGVITPEDHFTLTLCNPPFHSSAAEASAGSFRKWKNLGKGKSQKPALNFGGQSNELWCEGGEKAFITTMIDESVHYKNQVLWFSTLVSKGENLPVLQAVLKKVRAAEVRVIEMGQGQKISRLLAWSYFTKSEQQNWKEKLV